MLLLCHENILYASHIEQISVSASIENNFLAWNGCGNGSEGNLYLKNHAMIRSNAVLIHCLLGNAFPVYPINRD